MIDQAMPNRLIQAAASAAELHPAEASAVVIAVLRALAAKPEGYLRSEENGGIHRVRSLFAFADEIEAGAR